MSSGGRLGRGSGGGSGWALGRKKRAAECAVSHVRYCAPPLVLTESAHRCASVREEGERVRRRANRGRTARACRDKDRTPSRDLMTKSCTNRRSELVSYNEADPRPILTRALTNTLGFIPSPTFAAGTSQVYLYTPNGQTPSAKTQCTLSYSPHSSILLSPSAPQHHSPS